MTRQEQVINFHHQGFNCCQSVLGCFSEELKMDEEILLRLGSSFGGGIKRGEVCGAATGALMVLGLLKGFSDMSDPSVKDAAGEWTERFLNRFERECSGLRCKDLLGFDFSVDGEREKAKAAGVTVRVCPQLMTIAVALVEEQLREDFSNY